MSETVHKRQLELERASVPETVPKSQFESERGFESETASAGPVEVGACYRVRLLELASKSEPTESDLTSKSEPAFFDSVTRLLQVDRHPPAGPPGGAARSAGPRPPPDAAGGPGRVP